MARKEEPTEFERIQARVVECRRCPRLVQWREQVAAIKVRRFRDAPYWGRPVPAFGDPAARLVIVGLAPAAHGGNRTGRMFTGDRSGDWLFEALHRYGFASQPTSADANDGLVLTDCVVSASVRCAPPDNRPLPGEMDNCRVYLGEELQALAAARVYLALGGIAMQAFLKARAESGHPIPRPAPKFRHGGEWQLSSGRVLLASYHPSQQNTQTGRLTRPMFHDVFRRARLILDCADSG